MKKIVIIAILVVCILIGVGITYSMYISEANTNTSIALASFVFDADRKENINIPISNINPGDDLKYAFSVSNNSQNKRSDVTIKYNIIIKTMHFIPLDIELYDGEDNLILTCDETSQRNSLNEIECQTDDVTMSYIENIKDDYYLKVTFPEEYNTIEYSSLVDYINLEINSRQKIDEEDI